MIDFPREPNPGENLDASWGARVVRALRALFPMPGPGINVSTGPSGSSFSVVPQNMNNEAAHGMQWRITAKKVEGGVAVSVGAGLVAWGGGITYINNGADLGELAAGASARVVWATAAAPVPLVHDPRWPAGNAPDCECPDCDCPSREGDPDGTGGDAGELLLVPTVWDAPDGTTDCREIGLVEVSDAGAATVTQLQRDTIVARAIVGRADPGGDDPEDAPPCGNPLNEVSDYNPLDYPLEPPMQGGGSDNPLDNAGEGGYTPSCSDNANAA